MDFQILAYYYFEVYVQSVSCTTYYRALSMLRITQKNYYMIDIALLLAVT